MKPNPELNHALLNFEQMVQEATHISGSILDHLYVRKTLLVESVVCVGVKSMFLTDYETVFTAISSLSK